MGKYWNKVRKAKRRAYDRLEGQDDQSQAKKYSGWMTNLFSAKPSNDTKEDKSLLKDIKLVKYYDSSINKLKKMILNIDVPRFEKAYIETIQALNLQIVQEQSEVLEVNYPLNNRKIIENQFFDEEGNIFNSMLKSFASGISSVKGSPLDKDKLLIQATTKNSPFCEIITKTPIDKKKIFGSLKQTSSSLLRKAQAMNKPIHSNRKLFENGEDEKLSSASNHEALHILNKENNCNNGKVAVLKLQSPIPTVKGSWNCAVSPKNGEKTVKIGSPDSVYNKSPPLVLYPKAHCINLKSSTQFGTPQNGLKGSLIASSTCGSTQINFGNMRNTILMKSNEYKSRNAGVEDFSSGINYTDQKETLKSLGFKSRQISPTNTQSLAS